MMRKSILHLLFTLFLVPFLVAQAPSWYYNGTDNLEGYRLKTKLASIITNGHRDNGYKGLHNGYYDTDVDNYYEKDGTVLDMYSEDPTGNDPYEFNFGDTCGNYSREGDCYNREHLMPQSVFNKNHPMRSDIHHVVPSDGKVNGMRGDFPFGEVSNPTYTSKNGSKVGRCASAGFNGTCFEPIDEFKGDIARMIFYFVTRYQNNLSGFSTHNGMLNGSRDQGLTDWELKVLLDWHQQDPVSQRELDRNDAAYDYQNNRNPYIDNPNWVLQIWDPSRLNVQEAITVEKLQFYPNPTPNHKIFAKGKDIDKIENLKIFNVAGQMLKHIVNPFVDGNSLDLQGLENGVYYLQTDQHLEKIIIK